MKPIVVRSSINFHYTIYVVLWEGKNSKYNKSVASRRRRESTADSKHSSSQQSESIIQAGVVSATMEQLMFNLSL